MTFHICIRVGRLMFRDGQLLWDTWTQSVNGKTRWRTWRRLA